MAIRQVQRMKTPKKYCRPGDCVSVTYNKELLSTYNIEEEFQFDTIVIAYVDGDDAKRFGLINGLGVMLGLE